ncbi:hypothetical protein ACHAXA_004526 [Cyclostephanos tholiformis]|uniref:Uncharacterized protein n=1 Tax=Cyclostephanos tholiformis TaxID=382380 RepID=A0ABD3RV69_9STRA
MLAYSVAALLLVGSIATAEGGHGRSAALQKKIISKATLVGERQLTYEFEPSQYALSYHRCAAIQQYDDDVAANEDTSTVFATKNFAIFRFCPASTCDAQDDDDSSEEEVVSGARGSGCQSNYGEYMIELEDYLSIMAEYQDGLVDDFCTYCENYMYKVYQNYVSKCMNNGNCRRDLKYDDFKNNKTGEMQRELGMNFGACTNYATTCNGALDVDFKDYFECKQANGAWVGPHCSEDGYSVTLGVFSDEGCNVFLGGNVANYIDIDEDYLDETGIMAQDALTDWYNSRHGELSFLFEGEDENVCIPCKEEAYDSLYAELTAYANGDSTYIADTGDGEMGTLCTTLYESSAHCHKNFANFDRDNISERAWRQMQLSCSYIDSVILGNYDEMGYVNLQKNWIYNSENAPQWLRTTEPLANSVARVSPLQYVLLICSILAFVGLAAWSKSLHSSLVKREEPWSPRRSWGQQWSIFRGVDHPTINNIDSGIGVTRVRSDGTSYYMS